MTSAFSADGKLLAALGGAPDHALVVWLWDKGKVLGVSKLMQPVSRVSFNPTDSSTLGSSGARYLKLWRNSDGQLKAWNLAQFAELSALSETIDQLKENPLSRDGDYRVKLAQLESRQQEIKEAFEEW